MKRLGLAWVLAGMLLVSCDQAPPAARPTTRPAQADAQPVRLSARIESVSQLFPRRPTHLSADASGNLYWLQENPDGQDLLFVMGPRGLPRLVGLSSGRVLMQLGVRQSGTGVIQSIAMGADGAIHFFFHGGVGRSTLACLGRFFPASDEIQILADTSELEEATGMGPDLSLARGQLIAAGSRMSLFIRHSESWSLFQYQPRLVSRSSAMALEAPFTQIMGEEQPLDLSRGVYELSAGRGERLLITDTWTGALWEMDEFGTARVAQTLVGLPEELSHPAPLADGGVLLFAGDADPIPPRVEQRAATLILRPQFPSLIVWHNDQMQQITHEEIRGPAGLPLHALQLETLIPTPQANAWITYDVSSGQVLRLMLR